MNSWRCSSDLPGCVTLEGILALYKDVQSEAFRLGRKSEPTQGSLGNPASVSVAAPSFDLQSARSAQTKLPHPNAFSQNELGNNQRGLTPP